MPPYRLIYDDSCPLCRAFAERCRQLDQNGTIESVPLSRALTIEDVALPESSTLGRRLHLILPDQSIVSGVDAVAALASLSPSSRPIGRLLSVPGLHLIARFAYALIARYRRLLSRLIKRDSPGQKQKSGQS